VKLPRVDNLVLTEGSLEEAQMDQHFIDTLMDGLDLLHEKKVFHRDLHLKNILVAPDKDEDGTSGPNFGFWFIDFGKSICPSNDVWLNKEKKQFQDLLRGLIFS